MAAIKPSMDDLVTATSCLTEGSAQRSEVDKSLKVIQVIAKESGLEPDCIEVLMDYVLGKTGDGTLVHRTRVLRCLIPKTTVPIVAIIRALSAMRSLPGSIRLLLFRWMVLVFDLVDHRDHLRVLYDVVFQYLGYDDLRGTVCQLLCYMTTKTHVKEFRVHRLMELYQQVVVEKEASESPLMALLALYKLHCPHLVPLRNPPGRKVWFRQTEKVLASNIHRVQRLRPHPPINGANSDGRVLRCLSTVPPPTKRRKKATSIPAPLPSHTPHPQQEESEALVPIATLTTVSELCDCIHRIELPGQMAAMFDSPLLRHVFSMWPDPSAAHRLTYWLQMALAPELDNYEPGEPESAYLRQMLEYIVLLTDHLLESVPPVETFLLIFLESWNGTDYGDLVFRLLSYLSLQNFDDVNAGYLQPLKLLFVQKDLRYKCSYLACLTDLLQFWGSLEWPRYQERLRTGSSSKHLRLCAFPNSFWNKQDLPDFDPAVSISQLVTHTEHLLRIALLQERGHTHLNHAAATFYEVVMSLSGGDACGIPLMKVPHQQIVNQSLLGLEPAALSRMLFCYVQCHSFLAKIDKSHRDPVTTSSFNKVVLEMCNGLWRDLAFAANESTSAQKTRRRRSSSVSDLPIPTNLFTDAAREFLVGRGFAVDSICNRFNIAHHPALLGSVRDFFRKTQGDNFHRLKPKAVWKESQHIDAYLQYIEKRGLKGIPGFIRTFINRHSLNNTSVS